MINKMMYNFFSILFFMIVMIGIAAAMTLFPDGVYIEDKAMIESALSLVGASMFSGLITGSLGASIGESIK